MSARQKINTKPDKSNTESTYSISVFDCSEQELEASEHSINIFQAEDARFSTETEHQKKQVEYWRDRADDQDKKRQHWYKLYHLQYKRNQEQLGTISLKDARIAELEKEISQQAALIKKLQHELFGKSSEQDEITIPNGDDKPDKSKLPKEKRKRGRQKGAKGKGRQIQENVPIGEEKTYDIPQEEKICSDCGETPRECGSEDSEEVEIDVKAYRRKIKRKKYGHFCTIKQKWVTKCAKVPPKLTPKAGYGITVWLFLLIGKFLLHMPIHRLCMQLATKGILMSEGTVIAGFRRIDKLIDPLHEEIRRYSREDKHHWHIDDTGWKVFVTIDGKSGSGWNLWVFRSDNVCFYTISPSRGRKVPKEHLGNSTGIVTSDRLAANKKLGEFIVHSYCWVHERREFRELANGYPEISQLCQHFLGLIGCLFHFNKQRCLSQPDSIEYFAANAQLKNALDQIKEASEKQLADPSCHEEIRRVCKGIIGDWDGLSLFFDFPHVPPDNNPAEQALRGPVVGRKSYYGNHSQWMANFTAKMFTLCETLKLNNINLEEFLKEYFTACANNGGKPPTNAIDFLPWNRKKSQADLCKTARPP